jgi:hypothetical protein
MAGPISIKTPKYPVTHFRGGLNTAVNSFHLSDNELRELENAYIDVRGAIRPAGGIRRYDDSTSTHLDAGRQDNQANQIVQYGLSDNTKEFVLQQARYIYADNDTRIFADVTDMDENEDGTIGISQWKDTMFFSSRNNSAKTYNKKASTTVFDAALTANTQITNINTIFSAFDAAGGGSLDTAKFYTYRFSMAHYHGNDFLGTTVALYKTLFFGGGISEQRRYSSAGQQTSTGGIEIRKGSSTLPSSITDGAKYINIYRTVGLSAFVDQDSSEDSFGLITQILVSDYEAAAVNDVLFTDTGSMNPNFAVPILYNILSNQPRCASTVVHKNRLWYLDIAETEGADIEGTIEGSRVRVYFSEYLEPSSLRITSWFDVGVGAGEPITVGASWKNKALYVFTTNSITGVFGGDNESINAISRTSGVIDIEVEVIDETVGCVSKKSLAEGEGGLIFLSNRGIEFFDGVRPKLLGGDDDRIKSFLEKIPAARRAHAAGVYIEKDRKYRLAISQGDVHPSRNTFFIEYDFRSDTYRTGRYRGTNTVGINDYVEARKSTEIPALYAAIDVTGSTADTTTGQVTVLDDVFYEFTTADGIQWSVKTKYYDCGDPDIEKRFFAAMLRLATPQSITIAYDIDEGNLEGSSAVDHTGTHSWDEDDLSWLGSAGQNLTHIWDGVDTGEQLFPLPDADSGQSSQMLRGRRVSFTISGTTTIEGLVFNGITIFFDPEERIRTKGKTTYG